MAEEITVWYDKEGDFLEVMFEKTNGFFKETANDAVMEKVSLDGRVVGFSILKVSQMKTSSRCLSSSKSDCGHRHLPLLQRYRAKVNAVRSGDSCVSSTPRPACGQTTYGIMSSSVPLLKFVMSS